jgi:ATP/maltotriose-dependent transcriptional regulator MalT
VTRTYQALFTWVWESAIPAVDYRRLGVRVRDGLTQQILVFLNAGYKDDAAARQLGLSVRTYRRHVAEIMRDLGAASRFQAGARAAKLGLQSPRVVSGTVSR